MGKISVVLGAVLALCGCAGYFDQHPANIRPESEALATVLTHQRGPARVAEAVLPPPPAPVVARQTAAPVVNVPSEMTPTTSQSYPAESAAHAVISASPPARLGAAASGSEVVAPRQAPAVATASTPPSLPAEAEPPPAVKPAAPVAAMQVLPLPEKQAADSMAAAPPISEPAPPPVAVEPIRETPPAPAANLVAPPPAPDAHCEAVARQHAEDAAASGLDRETQEIVRRGTYANCLAWDTAHPQSP